MKTKTVVLLGLIFVSCQTTRHKGNLQHMISPNGTTGDKEEKSKSEQGKKENFASKLRTPVKNHLVLKMDRTRSISAPFVSFRPWERYMVKKVGRAGFEGELDVLLLPQTVSKAPGNYSQLKDGVLYHQKKVIGLDLNALRKEEILGTLKAWLPKLHVVRLMNKHLCHPTVRLLINSRGKNPLMLHVEKTSAESIRCLSKYTLDKIYLYLEGTEENTTKKATALSLPKNKPLLGLSAHWIKLGDHAFIALGSYKNLQYLHLDHSIFKEKNLSRLVHLVTLKDLSLVDTQLSDRGVEIISSMQLDRLNLSENKSGSASWVKWLRTQRNITTLSLNNPGGITNLSFPFLLRMKSLKTLSVQNTMMDKKLCPVIANLNGLRELTVSAPHSSSTCIKMWKQLTKLVIRESIHSNEQMYALSSLTRLTYLDISHQEEGCGCSFELGLINRSINTLGNLHGLKTLKIKNLASREAIDLSFLTGLRALEELDLRLIGYGKWIDTLVTGLSNLKVLRMSIYKVPKGFFKMLAMRSRIRLLHLSEEPNSEAKKLLLQKDVKFATIVRDDEGEFPYLPAEIDSFSIQDLKGLNSLTALYLSGPPTDKEMEIIASFKNLKKLEISTANLTPKGLRLLGSLKGLQELDIFGHWKSIYAFLKKFKFVHLKKLILGHFEEKLSPSIVSLDFLKNMPLLEVLKMDGLRLSANEERYLNSLKYLKELSLAGASFSGKNWNLPNLITLNLSHVKNANFSFLKYSSKLQWLDLEFGNISCKALNKYVKTTSLNFFNVGYVGISNKCTGVILRQKNLKFLGMANADFDPVIYRSLVFLKHLNFINGHCLGHESRTWEKVGKSDCKEVLRFRKKRPEVGIFNKCCGMYF
ncbi:hypothetical protein KKF84_16650 [Myxococcota bacterium]|nr:hypothetical protein [Myxococcota bacterium]